MSWHQLSTNWSEMRFCVLVQPWVYLQVNIPEAIKAPVSTTLGTVVKPKEERVKKITGELGGITCCSLGRQDAINSEHTEH